MLRYDDTGNMCYGATGKVMLSEASSYYQKNKALKVLLSKYRVLDIGADVYAYTSSGGIGGIWAGATLSFLKDFDDARDKAAWIYGLEHF